MRAQIQANTGNFAGQRFSLHGVDLTKIDGGGAREPKDHPALDGPGGGAAAAGGGGRSRPRGHACSSRPEN
eukprot:COSAG05_NODE_23_length_31591_cov_92.542995_11_plen_71_part_00